MVSIGMSCIMAGSTCNLPMMLHAEEVQTENMKPTYMVTSFDELNEEIAYQALSIGAEESKINFPDTLKVKVIRQVEEESSTEADEEESSTEAVEEEASTEAEEETTSKVLESQTEAESQTEEESEPQTEVESQTEIESESQTEVELQTEVENETLESESETEVPMTETEVPETTAASEPQTQVPETTASESETESTEQLESDTTEEESSIVASLIDSIKGLFAPVEVYAAEEHITYGAGEGNGAEDSQEGEEWTIEHITWKLDAEKSSLPEFDSSEESAGAVYIYTPTIPETDENGNHYILSEEAILPEIYVMVDCVDNGIVLYSSNIVDSGTCGAEGNNGDNLTWILDDEGVLTISGTGAMANWNRRGSPWYANKDKIESVMIEDGVTSIGKYAFFDCSSLASIKLPNSISSIGIAAFNNCSSLASITLPNSISSIGELAFYYCSSLTSITIPNSVTNIEKYAFCGCSMLASITISNSVTSIADSTFENCTRLKSITIPNNVISIGENAFHDCFCLTSVIYLGNTEQWNAIKKGRSALSAAQLKNVKCHEHSHALAWSNNATYHWHQCTDEACPVKDEPQAQDSCALHDWENGKCRVCGYICDHTKAEKWIQTAEKHKKKCNNCGVVTVVEETHEWKDGVCSECGYVCKHTGGTATCTAKAVCTTCGIEYGEKDSNKHENLYHAAQAPTCTKNGHEAYWKCKNCAKLFSDEAGTHEISNPVEINASGHDLKKVEKKEAGCTETGHEAYWKCKNCAKLFSDEAGTHEIINPVEINANGHNLEKVEKKEAGCTETGHEAYWKCQKCAKLFSDEAGKNEINNPVEINANGHALEKVEKKEAGCTETGHEAYWKCKKCAKLFSDEAGTHEISNPVEINANGHDLKKVEKKAPTCTEIGWEAYDTCKREGCDYTTYKELPALNHDLEYHEAKAATCTEIGWEAYDTCKREGCGYTTYVELPALNHDLEHHEAQAATCTEIGWEAYDTCKREGCDYTTYKELPVLGHEDSNNDHLCDACSTKISDHSYESKIAREATTTYTGIRLHTCTKCGHSYTEELAKLPSQTNQADQTNQIEPVNNGNEKDFIGTVTSVFLNVTDLAAKNFRISFWLMIQMLLKEVMQLW